MEIRPASITQLSNARNGRYVEIGDDVQGVANALWNIDKHIRLRYSEAGDYFCIYWTDNPNLADEDEGEHTTYLIFTAQDLDHRIVKHMEEVYWRCKQPGYSFADELDAHEEKAKAEDRHKWSEQHGEMWEKLAHAMRRDLGYDKSRVFVPS